MVIVIIVEKIPTFIGNWNKVTSNIKVRKSYIDFFYSFKIFLLLIIFKQLSNLAHDLGTKISKNMKKLNRKLKNSLNIGNCFLITPNNMMPMSEEEFRVWASGRVPHVPLAVKGHTFILVKENIIKVDGGNFVYEEALELVRMFNSRNPLAQINANIIILERNGALRVIVLALIIILLVAVFVLARR